MRFGRLIGGHAGDRRGLRPRSGAIGGHDAYVIVLGDLAQQVRQDGAVAFPAGVNSTAWISEVAVSIARCTLRPWRRGMLREL